MRRVILLFLIALNVVSAITVEIPTDTPIKNISRNTITTSDSAAQIYPNYSLHYYILKLPSANLNVQINTANFEKILTRGNITEPKLYPITSENTYLKNIGQYENGTNITTNYTIYTGGAATNNLNTAVARNYIVEFKTEAWVSGHYNLTTGTLKFDPDVSACGTLSASTSYTLTANLSADADSCIIFGGNNIIFNMNNHHINISGLGVDAMDFNGRSNNIVANGTINNYGGVAASGYSISLYASSSSNIFYNIIFNSTDKGTPVVIQQTSDSNLFYNNTFFVPALIYGINLIQGTGNIFRTNYFYGDGASTTIDIDTTGNTFCLNNITGTYTDYIRTHAINNFNCSFQDQIQGNIYPGLNSSNLTGTDQSITLSNYKVATSGTSYPYNYTGAGSRFNCPYDGCADYAPLYYSPATITSPDFQFYGQSSGWYKPNNAILNDSIYTRYTFLINNYTNTTYLNGTNWNFTIASGKTINGITATICRYASNASSMSDIEVKLIKNQVVQSENKAFGYTWNTSKECVQYGSISDKWGTTWTPDDWNNNSSGIVIAVTNKNTTNDTSYRNTTMLFSPFTTLITENFTTGGTVGFVQSADYAGTAKKEPNTAEGWLLSNPINTDYCSKIYTVFETRNDDLDLAGDSRFYWINSSGANVLMSDIASFPHDTWYKINNSSTSSTYFYDGFRINFSSAGIANTETWWIDNVSIVCEGAHGVNSTIAYIDFVNISVNYTVSGPTMLSVNIFNASNGTTYYNNSEISCHANASSTDSYVSYNVTWFLNGSVNSTYTYVFNQGVRINVSNQKAANARTNDRWQCEVLANDSLGVSSRMNSTEITITTSEVAADTCSPPALATSDYVINMKDCCNFTTGFTVAKLIFNGTKSSNCNWGAIFNPTVNPPFIINYTSMTWANVTGSAFSGSGAPIWINTTTWWVKR